MDVTFHFTYENDGYVIDGRFFDDNGMPDRLYIDKDSEHLLKPKEYDIGIDSKGRVSEFYEEWFALDMISAEKAIEPIRIIHRYNKPFFWPESEEV